MGMSDNTSPLNSASSPFGSFRKAQVGGSGPPGGWRRNPAGAIAGEVFVWVASDSYGSRLAIMHGIQPIDVAERSESLR